MLPAPQVQNQNNNSAVVGRRLTKLAAKLAITYFALPYLAATPFSSALLTAAIDFGFSEDLDLADIAKTYTGTAIVNGLVAIYAGIALDLAPDFVDTTCAVDMMGELKQTRELLLNTVNFMRVGVQRVAPVVVSVCDIVKALPKAQP